jgi:hypothetical protein
MANTVNSDMISKYYDAGNEIIDINPIYILRSTLRFVQVNINLI